jgi:site-specific DNA-methyltransferase (adenine-specific)
MAELKIEYLSVGKLKPYEKNAKKHPTDQVEHIANSIREFGFRQPLVIDKDNVLVIGHGRLLAAKKLGLDTVPCVRVDDLTDEQIKALRLADNKTNESEWDFDLLGGELDDIFDIDMSEFGFELEDEEEPAEIVEDEAPEDVETRCKLGDIWQLGNHRLICGDSTDTAVIDRLMDGVKADMVFTDPPYNCNYGNIKHPKFKQREIKNDNMDAEAFRGFCVDFTLNIKEFATGCVYMCAGQGKDGRIMFTVADELLNNSTTIIWNKDHFTLGRGKYQNKYEPIWFGWVESGKDFCDDRTLTNVWDIKRPVKSELHPTMKPIELIATALKHNPKSKTVLDLFGGSGSTLIACEQLNRKCYMCELDPHYCDVIIQRWENLTGETAVLLNG